MQPLPRVVGTPRAKALLGQKSREALTAREERRSWYENAAAQRPPTPKAPVVCVVPPVPPQTHTEDVWAASVYDEARRQCGMPPYSASVVPARPWPGTEPRLPASEHSVGGAGSDDSSATLPSSAAALERRRRSPWRALLRILGCFGER